jgi:fatty-acyl-CoA synthase
MFEAHFGVPVTGAVLNTLNTRLDPEAIAFQLDHGEAKVLLTDREFSSTIARALALMTGPKPLVIDVLDAEFEGGKSLGELDYETFLAEGDPLRLDPARRRVGGHLAELHLGHHRQPQGRGLPTTAAPT